MRYKKPILRKGRDRVLGILMALTLLVLATFSYGKTVAASTGAYARLIDAADLLSDGEEVELLEKLDEISQRQEVDVTLVTVEEVENGYSLVEYADGLYEALGYGYGPTGDGLMLLISMEERDWYITTQGYGITAFTDYGIEYIGDHIVEDLGDGHYAKAFATYADMSDDFITRAKNGQPFDRGSAPKAPFPWHIATPFSFLIGWLASLMKRGSLRSELKSVRSKRSASNYTKKNSMNLTESREIFLYRTINRVRKEHDDKNHGSSTHMSSSGTTHGGGGGKF